MKINAKVYRIIVKLLLTVVILVAVGAIAFVGLQISGRNRLYHQNDKKRPDLSQSELVEVVDSSSEEEYAGTQEPGESTYIWQEGDIRYQGTIYRYNKDILTFLFLGIDKMKEVKPVKNGIDGGQSDAVFLLVLNPHSGDVSIIGIPRDTMTEITVYNKQGDYRGTATAQIALQHGYGDGAAVSCERSMDAVSKLFYDLPIHGYCALNMGAIPLINDAVGGVDIVALEDIKTSTGFAVKEGEELHLKGVDAYSYLRSRDVESAESAERRLERQKQYLTAYATKAMEVMKSDITLPVTLYNTVSKYMVTDIAVDEVSYLATRISEYHFGNPQMYSLKGEVTMGETFEEFYADETALYELILKVFYEPQ